MTEQRREASRLWILGIVLGVIGNILVSACVEISDNSGFKQSLWVLVLALSWIVFMRTVSESARIFNLPTRRITIITYLFLVFLVVWALVISFILPRFT